MIFFHKFSNGHKAINSISQLINEQGNIVYTFPQLVSLATSYFKQINKAPPNVTLVEFIRVAQILPWFVDQETAMELNMEVTMGELEATLK